MTEKGEPRWKVDLTVKLTPIKWEPINPEIKNKKPTKREQPYG